MGKIFTGWEAVPPSLIITPDETEPLKARFTMPNVNVIVKGKFEDDNYVDGIERHPDEGGPNPHNYVYENIGGKRYPTAQISKQVWMAENLDYNVSGSVYYNNATSPPFAKAGRLYTWSQATAANAVNGWHLPSRAEWSTLENSVGGSSTAGKHLKATSGWNAYSGIVNEDTYGFSALPGGQGSSSGSFHNVGYYGHWWSASEYDSDGAYRRYMYCGSEGVNNRDLDKFYKLSVRLVKN
jgi:uncharacterized protein (TIGR02145 family)